MPSSSSAVRPPGEGSTGSPSKKPRVDEAAVTVNGLWNSEWEGEPDAPRRWNVLEGDGSRAQVAQSLQLLADSGPRETCVASALDMAHLFGARARHRQEEIDKLTRMGAYIPVLLSDAPDKSRVFPYLWVDTESKSRLTIQDRKSYGASEDYVNVPTPTPHTNALMELLACVRGWPLSLT